MSIPTSNTNTTTPVLTSVFIAEDLRALLAKAPDYVLVTSFLEVVNTTGGPGAVMRIKAAGKKSIPPSSTSSASEGQIEVNGCPVPPCVTNSGVSLECIREVTEFLESYGFINFPFAK